MTVVASGYARVENDLYSTPEWATVALLRNLNPIAGLRIWEPAAGEHKMVNVLKAYGARVKTSDIKTYSVPHNKTYDFLSDERPPFHTLDGIITNPPYGPNNRHAAEFCRRALERCPGMVCMLMTAKFDFGKTRKDLFGHSRRFRGKIALVDRLQFFPGKDGTEDHAWYLWGRDYGNARLPWLRYEGKPL